MNISTQKKITIDYIKEQLKILSPETVLLSTEYIDNRHKLDFICSCGKNFQKNWTTIQQRKKCLCNSCSRKDGWSKIRREKDYSKHCFESFLVRGFTPIEEVKSEKQKVLCVDNDGYKGYISKENVCLGKYFSVFSVRFNKENLFYNLNNFIKVNNLQVEIIDCEIVDKAYDIKLLCKCECGNYFDAILSNFVTQGQWRCPVCSKAESNLEYTVELEINKYCNHYEKQKRFDECRNTTTECMLPFDFYIPKLNACVEVDGEQHFKESFVGVRNKKESDSLEAIQSRDKIKNEFCQKKQYQVASDFL